MKSTYKLLGVFWDRKEIIDTQFTVVRKCRDILDYRYERNLFDINDYVRKIKISELLKVNLEDVLSQLLRNYDIVIKLSE